MFVTHETRPIANWRMFFLLFNSIQFNSIQFNSIQFKEKDISPVCYRARIVRDRTFQASEQDGIDSP
jgi:hypothetical protein